MEQRKPVYFLEIFEEIMQGMSREDGVICDFNHAIKLYERTMNWPDSF